MGTIVQLELAGRDSEPVPHLRRTKQSTHWQLGQVVRCFQARRTASVHVGADNLLRWSQSMQRIPCDHPREEWQTDDPEGLHRRADYVEERTCGSEARE